MSTSGPKNIVSRALTEVVFEDQWGEIRTIHRQGPNQRLSVKKREDSPVHLLNRAAAFLIGNRIRAKRQERGMTLEELHDKAGLTSAGPRLSKNRMYEIESAGVGRASTRKRGTFQGVRLGTLYALAIALECEPSDLLPTAAEVAAAASVGFESPAPRLSKTA